jgi:hypothetical protein
MTRRGVEGPAARAAATGAAAGVTAALVWAAAEPLDRRAFGSRYSDVELLGTALTTRPRAWPVAGLALHALNGAAFGAAFGLLARRLPGRERRLAVGLALAEHAATWPLTGAVERRHPAADRLPPLAGSRRALAQATFRHALFGLTLGTVARSLARRGR